MSILKEDGLPIIFKQLRTGHNQKEFTFLKIRTMKNNTPSVTTNNANPLDYLNSGKTIRKYKIDEMPQLFNVVKGDINLIGFRPGLSTDLDLIKAREDNGVFSFMPGITGLAQVTGHKMDDAVTLSKVDKLYYEKKSMVLDLKILICTFSGLFRSDLQKLIKDSIQNV